MEKEQSDDESWFYPPLEEEEEGEQDGKEQNEYEEEESFQGREFFDSCSTDFDGSPEDAEKESEAMS
eukprot:12231973-Karenia_brevis.AAC.1